MALSLRDTPIKRKLMLVVLLTSSFALLLMGGSLIVYELVTFRRALAVNMGVVAQIVGSNSTAAIAFQDEKNAQEILSALAAEHQITAAAIYDREGKLFVRFPDDAPEKDFPSQPGPQGHAFERSHLSMYQPIMQEGVRLGTIYLQADLGQMYTRFAVYGALLLIVATCASIGAIALTTTLQRGISVPILDLAEVARAVSERKDYSVRGVKHGSDEIGQLTEAFNQMLTRLGESNAALTASEERLRLALEGSKTGTWEWNLKTGKVIWDDYMYPLFRRTREEFDGTIEGFIGAVHPEDRDVVMRVRKAALGERRDFEVSFRVIDPDGTIRYMQSRGRGSFDAAGNPLRMNGVTMDITASKQNEADLNRAKELAEAANQAKDNFLAILSHELRTPLTPVLATVAMLEDDPAIPEHVDHELEMIRRNIEVEARLIDDLLDVTGIARGKLELNRQIVDLRNLLEHAMQNYCAKEAARKHLQVSVEVPAAETHILADPSRMTQVLWNLLQNACKFTGDEGAIAIKLRNEPGPAVGGETQPALIVEIRDTGIGITAENLPCIFNAFEQGEHSRTRVFGGLGLGLAISRAIVELHGGTISAQSEGANRGATLTVRLPTVAKPADMRSRPTPARPAMAARHLRVLLVEDHPDTAEQLKRLLKRAGHKVECAGSLHEARALVASAERSGQQKRFDILISDLGLPDGSGHELMRDFAHGYGIPGIALSGYGMTEDVRNSIAAGFSRHITKPVDWQELQNAIQKIAEEGTL